MSERIRAGAMSGQRSEPAVPLARVFLDWTRIGVTGFGGPPAHIALLRRLMVDRRHWMDDREVQDAIAACNLLPGPASTQLAIFCARRVRGVGGAIVGGLGFIVPAVVMVIALSALFLASAPPAWIAGAGAGAGAAVPAVAVQAAISLLRPSWARVSGSGNAGSAGRRRRWVVYAGLGVVSGSLLGPYLVLVLLGCGVIELVLRIRLGARLSPFAGIAPLFATGTAAVSVGGLGALAWVAFKVGALSYGGGFVIVPLMGHDAVHTYHWLSDSRFATAVALGQATPGPVVATVAAVGYAAHGIGGAAFAAAVAFLPSFLIVLLAGGQFERLRGNAGAQALLDGAGPAAIGAILGAAIPLAGALREFWQFLVLAGAAIALLLARRGIVATLVATGVIGAVVGLVGGAVPR